MWSASLQEAQYAAGAILAAEREPNPPIRMGNVANWPATLCWLTSKVAMVACIPLSWPSAYTVERLGGTVRTKWWHRGLAHWTKSCHAQ